MHSGAEPGLCHSPSSRRNADEPRKRLRAAVVGCSVGRRHAAALARLSEYFELLAVCDTDVLRARSVAQESGGVEWVENYEALLSRRDLDLVSICTPPFLHFAQIVQALEAGCHVVCEKPMVGTLSEMDLLTEMAAQTHRRVIVPVFQMRFGSGLQKLKHLVDRGVTGRSYLTTIETAWSRGRDYYEVSWRRSWKGALGGCLLNHAVHAHDMLSYINGPVARVQAFAKTLVNPVETEDCAVASLEMANDSLASLAVTLGSARELTRLRFCFENLVAESNAMPYACADDPWQFTGASAKIGRQIEAVLQDYIPGREGYDAQFIDAYRVIQGNSRGVSCLADARTSIELATALYYSALNRVAVSLPLSKDHPAYRGFSPPEKQPFGPIAS